MPDYSLSKIYRIKSPSCDAVYVGATTQKYLSTRMKSHRASYKNWFNGKDNWCYSYLLLGFGDATIELIEEYPCNSKDQLAKREALIMNQTPNCVNRNTPGLNLIEAVQKWQRTHREEYLAYQKHYNTHKRKVAPISNGLADCQSN